VGWLLENTVRAAHKAVLARVIGAPVHLIGGAYIVKAGSAWLPLKEISRQHSHRPEPKQGRFQTIKSVEVLLGVRLPLLPAIAVLGTWMYGPIWKPPHEIKKVDGHRRNDTER